MVIYEQRKAKHINDNNIKYQKLSVKMIKTKLVKSLKDEYLKAGLYYCLETFETIEEAESFFLTPLSPKETGLPMCINLRCIENKDEQPFLRFQNDRNERFNYNWIKIYLDGTLDNYENKNIVFSDKEIKLLKDWITLNKDAITKHYYQEYDSLAMCQRFKKL